MKYIVKKGTHFDIDINPISKKILVIQKWKYNWISSGFSNWSYDEKREMHASFEKEMDLVWNRKARLTPKGSSLFARDHKNDVFILSFDIRWELSNAHWNVDVTKVAPRDINHRPYVKWETRKIQLYTADVKSIRKYLNPALYQKNIAHEFGHAIGNASAIANMHADEYSSKSQYFLDKKSLMNVGMELRKRHFDYVLREINTMIPNTDFKLSL